MSDNELFEKGLVNRREVLGDEYVDQSLANATEFSEPLQKLVTEFCWGEIWGRDGLERRERSIINLALMTAMNRPFELALHVRGAVNNGLTPDEIREVLLQCAVYAGIPAALDAFKTAQKVLKELDSGADN